MPVGYTRAIAKRPERLRDPNQLAKLIVAMEAGTAYHVWSLEEIARMVD